MVDNNKFSDDPILDQINNFLTNIQFNEEENNIIPYINFVYEENTDPQIDSLNFKCEVFFDKNYDLCQYECNNIEYVLQVNHCNHNIKIHFISYSDYKKCELEKKLLLKNFPRTKEVQKVLDVIYKLIAIYTLMKAKNILDSFITERANS